MNRIDLKFMDLKKKNRKALITFVTAGDPAPEVTIKLVKEMEDRGADIVELGIPYSDPVAEGPVIQRANRRALKNRLRIKDIMKMTDEIRKNTSIPLLYLLYYNCILQYGPEAFFEDCVKSGVDGVIIPDLPYEEKWEIEDFADKYNVYIITLVSPTSNDRIRRIAKDAKGFLYCVSSLGVTGVRDGFGTDFDAFLSLINGVSGIPRAIGFGISGPEHVRQLKGYSDGLIVGSAIVRLIEESGSAEDAVKNVGRFVETLRKALDNHDNC